MMAQYRRIKSELPKDALLLFRLGDFYEMFFEDAVVASDIHLLRVMAASGLGVAYVPDAMIASSDEGALVPVLPDQIGRLRPLRLVVPRVLATLRRPLA